MKIRHSSRRHAAQGLPPGLHPRWLLLLMLPFLLVPCVGDTPENGRWLPTTLPPVASRGGEMSEAQIDSQSATSLFGARQPGGGSRGRGEERERMVAEQIQARGIEDEAVLAAMRKVPRHAFIPEPLRASAYQDRPLSIGRGQTISQPYIVAAMSELARLKPGTRVLEVGTGSGYQAAVIHEIVGEVFSLEIVAELAESASAKLAELGYEHAHVRHADGYLGWPERAPFDRGSGTAAGSPYAP